MNYNIPNTTITRLTSYLRILEKLEKLGQKRTSSEEIAQEAQVTAFQVRKDLSYFGSFGKRGSGYSVAMLKREIIGVLGLSRAWKVVIVGMGRLGQAVAAYPIGNEYNFEYVGFFDENKALQGNLINGIPIRPLSDLAKVAKKLDVDMAFLAVPPEDAQKVAEEIIRVNINSILNFAPIVLRPPQTGDDSTSQNNWDGVNIEDVDLLTGIKRLAYYTRKSKLISEEKK